MGDNYSEVCWQNNLLKEATQLLPSRYTADDSWEQSQDTTTNHEFSQDSVELDLKPHHVSSESQDSLMINANTTPKHPENTDICISPFHAGHMENAEEGFTLLGESPKRRLGDSSVESSPKRMNFGSGSSSEFIDASLQSLENGNNSRELVSRNDRLISVESTSENNGQILNLEECHVVPRLLNSSSSSTASKSPAESPIGVTSIKNSQSALTERDVLDSDRINSKPRHVSIDSAMDSGMGDSCNSVDSSEEKGAADSNEEDEMKRNDFERRCWQAKPKESLASRLPGERRKKESRQS